MNQPENMMPSERTRNKRSVTSHTVPCIWNVQNNPRRQKVDWWLPEAGGKEESWRGTSDSMGFLWRGHVPEAVVGMVTQLRGYTEEPLNCTTLNGCIVWYMNYVSQ